MAVTYNGNGANKNNTQTSTANCVHLLESVQTEFTKNLLVSAAR